MECEVMLTCNLAKDTCSGRVSVTNNGVGHMSTAVSIPGANALMRQGLSLGRV